VSPTTRLLALFLGPALMSLLLVVYADIVLFWVLAADGVLLMVALLDMATLPRRRHVRLEREGGSILSVGTTNPFSLTIVNRCRRPVSIRVMESFDAGLPAG